MSIFPDSEYFDQKFEKLSLAEPTKFYDKRFEGCTFQACTLTEASFIGCTFRECIFRECDLSLLQVADSAFVETEFHQCKMIGINWTDAQWTLLSRLDCYHCDISHSTFTDLDLRDGHFSHCKVENCDFSGASLQRFDCRHANFLESRFAETNLSEADFTGAENYAINVLANTIKGAKFSLPQALALLHTLDIVLEDS